VSIRARRLPVSGLVFGLALVIVAAVAAQEPVGLRGSPIAGKTGLRLLVDDATPFLFDLDSGSVTRLRGLGAKRHGGYVLALSRSAAVVADYRASVNARLYLARSGRTTVTALGAARDVVPAADGRGVWVTRVQSKAHCALQHIALDGRSAAARAIPCAWVIRPGGSLGLVIRRARIIDPSSGRVVIASRRGVIAVAGDRLLLTGPIAYDRPNDTLAATLTLLDSSTHSERTLRVPRTTGSLEDPAIDPRGRYIALPFGNPSYQQSGSQVLDVWVIDTLTGALTHLPGTPAYAHLKATSMQWTHDGRLVLLGEDDNGSFVALWRPGQPTLGLKRVRLPAGASNSFAPLG
jgi:hypothetical protein